MTVLLLIAAAVIGALLGVAFDSPAVGAIATLILGAYLTAVTRVLLGKRP